MLGAQSSRGSGAGRFIVVDGLDATGKTTLALELARSLSAEALKCPPQLVAPALGDEDLRMHFDKQPPPERRAYYPAANLIASEQAKLVLASGKHVVMDRYVVLDEHGRRPSQPWMHFRTCLWRLPWWTVNILLSCSRRTS